MPGLGSDSMGAKYLMDVINYDNNHLKVLLSFLYYALLYESNSIKFKEKREKWKRKNFKVILKR